MNKIFSPKSNYTNTIKKLINPDEEAVKQLKYYDVTEINHSILDINQSINKSVNIPVLNRIIKSSKESINYEKTTEGNNL